MTLVEVIRELEAPADFKGGNDKQRKKLNEIVAFLRGLKQGTDQVAEGKHVQEVVVVVDGVSRALPFLLDTGE